MANNYSFSVMPSVSISRSRFERKSQHKTSFNLGDIIPIYVDEVLPGDTRSFDMAALVRMSTPIAPIMDNIYLDFFAFFVPNRLVWDHWKEFQGENNESAGIPSTTYSVPKILVTAPATTGSLSDYFGIPIGRTLSSGINALPYRGYALIYNRWFRNQNIIAPLAVQTGDTYGAIVGSTDITGLSIQKASKLPDYFTKCLPYAQKGAAVTIPLGSSAPIIGASILHSVGSERLKAYTPLGSTSGYATVSIDVGTKNLVKRENDSGSTATTNPITQVNWVADLSQATSATINQLRYAFQLQKLLEKDALYGTRYWEILAAHFGVTAPDASLQDPEYLGGQRMNINVDQVLSTAGYDASTTTTVGAPGANSVSGFKGSLFTKSFVEHGHIFILAVARHDQTYSSGLNRMWLRDSRYDFYMPVFANLGAQAVKTCELFTQNYDTYSTIFGYQEAWAEYRYKPSIASGLLNPDAANSLDYWTLTNKFSAPPTLSQSFIEQDRTALSRALVTGSTGPDFIGDFYFKDIAVRPMPVYSIPGLIDHH